MKNILYLIFSFLTVCVSAQEGIHHALLSETKQLNELALSSTVVSFSSEQTDLQSTAGQLYGPRSFWQDGKTYWAHQTPLAKVKLFVYDERYGVRNPVGVGRWATIETHHEVVTYRHNNRLYFFQEQQHNLGPLQIYKARNTDD